jgi:hypothetical protein
MQHLRQMVQVVDFGVAGVHGQEESAGQVENPCIGTSERFEHDRNDF